MVKLPFKSKFGFDSNNKHIKNVADPIDELDGANKKYVDEKVSIPNTSFIYVTDVISSDVNSPVSKNTLNGIYVETAQSAATNLNIILRFNKPLTSLGLPDIKYSTSPTDELPVIFYSIFTQTELDFIDLSIPEQQLTNGVFKILSNDYVQTFELSFSISNDNLYYFFKNGETIYKLQLIQSQPPLVISAAIISEYPGTQTELANNEPIVISVTSDKNIYGIEVGGLYFDSVSVDYNGSLSTESITTYTNCEGVINTDVGLNAYFTIRVKDEFGTWSSIYDSNGGLTDGVDYIVVNNTQPVFSNKILTYSNSPYTAIDIGDTATIQHSVSYLGNGTVEATGIPQVNIGKVNNLTFNVSTNSNLYVYDTDTVFITATRSSNGLYSQYGVKVNIVSIDISSISLSNNIFRSSNNATYNRFNIIADQVVFSSNITTSIIGTTSENGIINDNIIEDNGISIQDNVEKIEFINGLQVTLTGLSGRITSTQFNVINKGFMSRTYSNLNLYNPIDIPLVTDPSKVEVKLGDANNQNILTYSNGNINILWEYSYDYVISNQVLEFQVFKKSPTEWAITFDENVAAEAGGNYDINATMIIEEKI